MDRFLSKLGYFFKEGLSGVFVNGFMSFASVFVIAACLLITGSFALLSMNIDYIIGNLENQFEIVAFVNETYTEEEAKSLQSKLEELENVQTAEYTSREQAYEDFLATYEDNRLFEEINADVFRDRYSITLNDISLAKTTQVEVLQIPGIVKANAHLEISEGFVTLRNVVSIVCGALIVVLFVVSIFMMSNTIRLSTFSRREEIAIMRMVGANGSFVRTPFIIEGMILGLIGSAIAYLAQWAVYTFALKQAAGSDMLGFLVLLPFSSVALPTLTAFAAIGLIIGAGGSGTAIRNYLKI